MAKHQLPPLPYCVRRSRSRTSTPDHGDPPRQAPRGVRHNSMPPSTSTRSSRARVEDLLRRPLAIPEDIRTAVRNNGGGHANHAFFWPLLSPKGAAAPVGELAAVIGAEFGAFDAFKRSLRPPRRPAFGSGWAWLSLDGKGKLVVSSTANQDSPVFRRPEAGARPRRLGARLLPQVPEPAAGLRRAFLRTSSIGTAPTRTFWRRAADSPKGLVDHDAPAGQPAALSFE